MSALRPAVALVLALALVACRGAGGATDEPLSEGGRAALAELADLLAGTFTNAEQAAAAPGEHASERLVVVRLWPRRGDGPWLLVERAPMRALDRPTRVEVWRLVRVQEGLWRIDPHGLPGAPADHAGAFAAPEALAHLAPQQLVERPGCQVLLSRSTEGGFQGATLGTGCERDADGAYTTFHLGAQDGRVTLWERRHGADGAVLVGHAREPTLFDRRSRYAPATPTR